LGRPWMADAHTRAPEVGAQLADQRADAVLAGRPPALLHAETARGQIDLVVEDDHLRRLNLVEARRLGDGPAALVHEGLGLHQQHLDPALRRLDLALADHRLEFGPLGPERPAPCDLVGGHEADVVAVALVFRAWIAEAGDD